MDCFNFMKKYPVLVYLLLAMGAPGAAFAQQRYDYLEQAGVGAALYRAPEAAKYPYRYEGTQYAYSEEFVKGDVRYNNVTYKGVLLNLSASMDELHIMAPMGMIVLALDKRWVDHFTLGDREFVAAMGDNAVDGLQEGYYEVLHEGRALLLKKHIKKIKVTRHETKGIYREFESLNRYYAVKDGIPYPVVRKSDLIKLYAGKKREIKDMVRRGNGIYNGRDNRERLFTAIMEVVDK